MSRFDPDSWFYVEPDVPSILQIVVMYTVAISALLLNIPVFLTVPRLHEKVNCSTRYGMLNLAVTDALLGFGLMIGRTVYLVDATSFLKHICKVDGIFNPFIAIMSAFGLVFLNLDKFLALQFPLRYRIWMTPRKTIGVLVGIWLFCAVLFAFVLGGGYFEADNFSNSYLCFIVYDDTNTSTIIVVIICFVLIQAIPFCISVVTIVGMCLILRKHRRQANILQEGQQAVNRNERAVVYTIFALNFIYFLMVSPFFIFDSLWGIFNGPYLGPYTEFIVMWLGAANSVMNPLIYIPSMRSYRKELMHGIRRLFAKIGRQRVHPNERSRRNKDSTPSASCPMQNSGTCSTTM